MPKNLGVMWHTPFPKIFKGSHTVLTAIFQMNLGKPVVHSFALTDRWGCHKVLQPVPHPLISTIIPKGFYRPDALPVAQWTASKHWRCSERATTVTRMRGNAQLDGRPLLPPSECYWVVNASPPNYSQWMGQNSGPIFSRLCTKAYQIKFACAGVSVVCDTIFRLTMSCCVPEIFAI